MKVSVLRHVLVLTGTTLLLTLAACGEKKEDGSGDTKAVKADAGSGAASGDTANCNVPASGTTVAAAGTGAASGSGAAAGSASAAALLGCGSGAGSIAANAAKPAGSFPAEICSWKVNDKGGCMTCIPRDLELLKCVKDVKKEFSPETDCTWDEGKEALACDTGTNEDLSWDLAKKSRTEEIYEKLPFLIAGAKFLLGEKFKDEKKKEIIMSALDIFQNNAAVIFNSGDVTPVAEQVAELAKKAKPNIKDEELQSIKTQLSTTINGVNAKRKNGEFADADAITLLAGFITNLPSDLIGSDASGVDLSSLSDALAKGSVDDLLGSVVGAAAGGESGATGSTGANAATGANGTTGASAATGG